MTNMKDFLGKELNVGDTVIFIEIGYRNLLKGEIIKITPKTVLIQHNKTNNYSRETRQTPDQIVKV